MPRLSASASRSSLAAVMLLSAAPDATAQNTGITLTHGVDAHFDVPNAPELVPNSGITIEAWITYDETSIPTGTYHWPTICRHTVTPGQESYFVRVGASNTNNLSFEFLIRTTSGTSLLAWTFLPGQLSTLTHVAATYDGSNQTIYENGMQVAQQAVTGGGPLVDNGGVLRVGNGDTSSPGAETWNGHIDELRIWPYARSQTEISSTISDQLGSLPGGCVTFNLNNVYFDSSTGLMGNPNGPIVFASNTLNLASPITGATGYGSSTSNCGTIRQTIGSLPRVGNPSFAWVGTSGPASAPGLLLVGAGPPPSPLTVFGVALQVDLTGAVTGGIQTGPLGDARVSLPIPNVASLAGASLASQFVFVDGACGPQGLSASDGLTITLQ